jgi:hypothetical protein
MFHKVILRSGQFIMKPKHIEINIDSFRMLVEDSLAIYSKASPHVEKYKVDLVSRRQFIWDSTFDRLGRDRPDWLSEVTPVRNANIPYFSPLNQGQYNQGINKYTEIIEPLEAPWDWNKTDKTLTVPYSATYEITACYRHIIESFEDEDTGEELYEVKTIDEYDHVFLKILRAMFITGLGRSRKAFTMNDLPILMDADQMASEGQQMLEEAKQELQNIQKAYLAYG